MSIPVVIPTWLTERIYGMALFNSCMYDSENDPDVDPFANCDDWSEVVKDLAPILGKTPKLAEGESSDE